MPAVQHWGRKESIIWPPRGYIYTIGAFFVALARHGFADVRPFRAGLHAASEILPAVLRAELSWRDNCTQRTSTSCSTLQTDDRCDGWRLRTTCSPGSRSRPPAVRCLCS